MCPGHRAIDTPAFLPTPLFLAAEPVFVSVDEKLSVLLSKTGGLESLEVQGTMSLVVGNDADAYVAVQVRGRATS
jgi:hypothetical protein